jgi:iron complex outermembrane recepter protein
MRRHWLLATTAAIAIGASSPALATDAPEPARNWQERLRQLDRGAAPRRGFEPLELAQAFAQAEPANFDIPSQPLPQALVRFARDVKIEIFFDDAIAQGIVSPGVQGRFTREEALRRLLIGSGLTYRFTDANTITLEKAPATGGRIQQLEPVLVEAQRAVALNNTISSPPPEFPGGQVARGGRVGMLGNRDIMDTPFNTTNYTAQKIKDQQAVTAADVVEGDPSVRSSAARGGILDAFFIRGFPVGEGNLGEIAFDGVYGVAPNYRVFTDYAERIEVVKGPTALLYGMSPNSAVGGVINIVPKRAGDNPLTRLTADFASDSQLGGGVDVSRRFGRDREFGIRVNTSYHNGDTPLDHQSREAFVGALAADYRGERFRASLDFISQEEDFDAPSRPFLLGAGVQTPSAPNGRLNVSPSWARSEIVDRSLLLRTEYDVNDTVTLFADAGGGRTTVERLSGQTITILNAAGDTSSTPVNFKFAIDRRVFDSGLRANFDTAGIDHTATLQASYYQDQLSRGSTTGSSVMLSNIYAPVDFAPISVAEPNRVPKVSESTLTGFAVGDTLSILNKRVQLTLGTRYQNIESDNFDTIGNTSSSYADNALTPLAGLIVKPWENVSLYANYIEGLSRGDLAPSTAVNAGEALAPYIAKQAEVGVKVDFGRIGAIASLFQIEKPFGQLVNNVFSAGGEQRNRGLEFAVFGEVVPSVRVLAGVAFIDGEMTKTNSSATVGNRPIGVPKVQANLSAEWDTPFLDGFTVAGALIYTGDQYVNAANTQSIPSWTRFDVGARYRVTLADKPVAFRATVQNVFDQDYWSGVASFSAIAQGAPRTLLLSVTTDF